MEVSFGKLIFHSSEESQDMWKGSQGIFGGKPRTNITKSVFRTMEWADEVHRGVPGRQSRTAAIFK